MFIFTFVFTHFELFHFLGYGDIFPVTHLGRAVTIAACIWGVFVLSLIVVSLNNMIEMSKEESRFDIPVRGNCLSNRQNAIGPKAVITSAVRIPQHRFSHIPFVNSDVVRRRRHRQP